MHLVSAARPGCSPAGSAATAPAPNASISSSSSSASPAATEQKQQPEQQAELAATKHELAELSRLVLKQQNQLGDLQEQLAGLQAAVCKLDVSAPGCKRSR